MNLRRRRFLLICRRVTWTVISISNNVGGEAWIPEYDWRNQALKPGETKSCTSFRISSQQKIILIITRLRAVRCAFRSMSSNTLISNSLSPSPSVGYETVTVLFLGSGSDSWASWRMFCFQISKRISHMCVWSRYVEDALNTVCVNLRSWLNSSFVGANDVRGKRSKTRRRKSEDYFMWALNHSFFYAVHGYIRIIVLF